MAASNPGGAWQRWRDGFRSRRTGLPSQPEGATAASARGDKATGAAWQLPMLLGLGMLFHAGLMLAWIRLDRLVSPQVCCSMASGVSGLLRLEATQGLWTASSDLYPGWLNWLGLLSFHLFGPHPDYLLYATLALTLLTQLGLYRVGKRLEAPLAGVLAAWLLPLMPDAAHAIRAWSPLVPHFLLLVGAFACLLASRSFTRAWPLAGFVVLVTAGVSLSPIISDNILFLAGAGAMALGAASRGALLGRDAWGRVISRERSLVLAGLTGMVLALLLEFFLWSKVDFAYYRRELASTAYQQAYPRLHPQALLAYPMYLARAGLGPVFSGLLLLTLPLFAWKGKARAELLSWALLPLLLLAFTAKKNPYYPFPVLPALALIPALAVAGWTSRGGRRVLGGLCLLPVLPWLVQSFPGLAWPGARWLEAERDLRTLAPLFQTLPAPRLEVHPTWQLERLTRFLLAHLPTQSCPQTVLVQAFDAEDFSAVTLTLASVNPCLEVRGWPDDEATRKAEYLVRMGFFGWPGREPPPNLLSPEEMQRCYQAELPWDGQLRAEKAAGSLELVAVDTRVQPCLELYRRKVMDRPAQ